MRSRPDISASPLGTGAALGRLVAGRHRASSLNRSAPVADPLVTGLTRGPGGQRRRGGARARAQPRCRRRITRLPARWLLPGQATQLPARARRAATGTAVRCSPSRSAAGRRTWRWPSPRRSSGDDPTACLVPAALAAQWRAVAAEGRACRWTSAPTSRRAAAGCPPGPRPRDHRREPSLPEPAHPALRARGAVAGRTGGCCSSAPPRW